MTTYKNRLPQSALMGYISPAPHKTGAGISTPPTNKAHNRASGFFTCKASSHLFIRIMVGRAGQPQGWPVSLFAGSANPARLTTPRLAPLGGELSQLTKQGEPSWQTVNHASASTTPTLTFSASIPRPKSTADCTAPTVSRSSCTSTCCTNAIATFCRRISPPSLAIWPTICASCNNWSASQSQTARRTQRNPPRRPCSTRSGAFAHPVKTYREVWP
ncbi:ash family protein [Salmonella enterica]|nr:ash family protein [Salmonella enterica]HEC8458492.1 ash family protein [Salmonella enterica subsp. enterica serovar Poona]